MYIVVYILLQVVAANGIAVPRVAFVLSAVCAIAQILKKLLMFCCAIGTYSIPKTK